MPSGIAIFLVGAGLGAVLLLLGAWLGFIAGRRQGRGEGSEIVDSGRMLRLLQELGEWTSEYSGSVSHYQDELGEMSAAVRHIARGGSDPELAQVAGLLERIMEGNQALQDRLEAAERQLDRQTNQLQQYLSEARTDALTGLANRRAFDERLEELFALWKQGGAMFSLLLVDVDHFKQINDRYGHPAGDQILKEVSATLASNLEGASLVARFGGEEFAVLLPAPLRLAAERADKVRQLLAKNPLWVEGRMIRLTISCGVAEPREDTVAGAVLRRADEALYAAKGRGRNRVYFHEGRQVVLVGAPEVAGPEIAGSAT